MPPSKHSGSSRSAHKDSDQMPSDQNYALGEYSFSVVRSAGTSPNYDKIEAICTKGGKNARKSIQVLSNTKMDGWYVEANESEATVYALVQVPVGDDERTSPFIPDGIPCGNTVTYNRDINLGTADVTYSATGSLVSSVNRGPGYFSIGTIFASPSAGNVGSIDYVPSTGSPTHTDLTSNTPYTYDGKTVYYRGFDEATGYNMNTISGPIVSAWPTTAEKIAWTIIYGTPSGDEYETKEIMVGRFAIDIEDAGGVGPGGGTGGWTDPEDYDEDWEEGDPTHTLYVEVTGALSGRHNDPIVDPSYSYIPADKDTVKDYGCGGDGGHGGGGGAGASTVVIHKFATNQANSKEVTAISRRHGYGSGGGKGGKGGDGCILVYY